MDIKGFSLTFTVADNGEFVTNQAKFIKVVEDMMREEGFAPVVELDPQYLVTYNADKNNFEISVEIYGGFVGENSWVIPATSVNIKTQNYLRASKPKQFLTV